jgi:epoxyqueuosine reductase
MTGAELTELATELGIDAVGVASVEPYEDTERHILERRERGLFADMRFTMARPEVSCHPASLLENARSIVAGALCYYRRGVELEIDEGKLPRYTWTDEYAVLRQRLALLGERLGGAFRVLVDDNDHVDRAAAVRAGVAFYGKNTMAITRRHGSWVVLGVLITDVEIERSPPLELDCGDCRLCIDACPTGALDDPGVLDATKCLSYWTQAPASIPEPYREALGASVYGCDICQEVCPWNRGVEKRRRDVDGAPSRGRVSLVEWLECDGADLVSELDRLYVPRNDARWLRRNALVAAGNVGSPALGPLVARHAQDADPIVREAAEWAAHRIRERGR